MTPRIAAIVPIKCRKARATMLAPPVEVMAPLRPLRQDSWMAIPQRAFLQLTNPESSPFFFKEASGASTGSSEFGLAQRRWDRLARVEISLRRQTALV